MEFRILANGRLCVLLHIIASAVANCSVMTLKDAHETPQVKLMRRPRYSLANGTEKLTFVDWFTKKLSVRRQ